MATIRVLIVDDEEPFLRNVESYLKSFGEEFEVLTAASAEDALGLVETADVNVLLTDVRLPKMDGIELVRQSIEMHPSLRVIVMTAFSSPDIRKTALREGALRFIEKPLDLKELRTTLTELGVSENGWSGLVGGLDLFDLAQLMSLSGKTKIVRVTYLRKKGTLVFDAGQLIHASSGKIKGKKAFFEMTGWEGGRFQELASNQRSKYKKNITSRTTNLLMEAARLKDETAAGIIPDAESTSGQDIDLDLEQLTKDADKMSVRAGKPQTEPDPTGLKEDFAATTVTDPNKLRSSTNNPIINDTTQTKKGKESSNMNEEKKGKGQLLTEHLEALLATSGDINGAIVIGHDGLVLASSLPMGGHDATRVGAEGAALLGLSKKTLATLKCGDFQGAILEGKDGWLISVAGGAKTVVFGLTDADVNLGMAMMEMRDIAEDIAGVMG
ncbi:MAG: response regulator [Thermoanaerobaculales bacterium]|nr:response regulator [Thermoanaerobaculales bacterium]